ncbi:hypothetical protein CPB84DRAFT_1233725 [Gymnopilus junonius]|uniref:Uncharacterized protein n=1 Tax=Gymnopilus junonius TaxID=109634 RepID=A0A9P5TSJ6_GYMJU|nr:hypothetical protein CPB84DRAFT_1233725 [Gymnopilus junonius]
MLMSHKIFLKFALLMVHIFAGVANPIGTRASEDLVQTPAGLFPISNVHAVPLGARVHQTPTAVQVIAANGTVIHSAPITLNPAVIPLQKPGNLSSSSRRALRSGYVVYTDWENIDPSPISFFATSWTVPPTPATYDGQLLYWFNGLVPNSYDGILQPVLQFGFSPAGGGPYYSLASWYLINSNVYHTNITPVQPGQGLAGYMTLEQTSMSGSTTTYDWQSTFVGFPATTLSATTTQVLNGAYEVLEIYTTQTTSDLPTGSTAFEHINIVTQNEQNPIILWNAVSDTSDGISMSVISSSSIDGAVKVTY